MIIKCKRGRWSSHLLNITKSFSAAELLRRKEQTKKKQCCVVEQHVEQSGFTGRSRARLTDSSSLCNRMQEQKKKSNKPLLFQPIRDTNSKVELKLRGKFCINRLKLSHGNFMQYQREVLTFCQ